MQEDSTHDADHVYSIASGENQRPRAFLTNENFDLMANPDKYPCGDFGYSVSRSGSQLENTSTNVC